MLLTEKNDTDVNQEWHVARVSDIPGEGGRDIEETAVDSTQVQEQLGSVLVHEFNKQNTT